MKKIKHINPQLFSSLFMMIVIGALLISISFSWFSQNINTRSSGLSISSSDNRISFSPTVTVKKYIAGNLISSDEYRADDRSTYYYLWDSELDDFAKDEQGNQIPITISGLLPGEVVDFEFGYTCTDGLIGKKLKIYFDRITSDTFVEYDIDGNDLATHSILSVYKVSFLDGEEFTDGEWLVRAESGVDDVVSTRFSLSTPTWQKVSENPQENYAKATFRIVLDLEQYNTLRTSTNQLSEKSFSIGALRIEATTND